MLKFRKLLSEVQNMPVSIIPDVTRLPETIEFSTQYHLGWEFNDFMFPTVLDNEDEIARLTDVYQSHDMPRVRSLHGAFLDVTVHSSDARIREVSDLRINQSIAAAQALSCGKVIFHSGSIPNFHDKAYCDDWVKKNAAYWTAKTQQYPGIDLLMENMFDMTPDLLLRLGEELNGVSCFGICLDFAHATVFGEGEYSADEFVKTLAPYVRHIHLNDCDLRHDLHLPIGDGLINWDRFAELYAEQMKGASMLIEVKELEGQKRSLDFLLELFTRHGITL